MNTVLKGLSFSRVKVAGRRVDLEAAIRGQNKLGCGFRLELLSRVTASNGIGL